MRGIHRLAVVLFFCIAATTLNSPAAESTTGPAAEKWKATFTQWKDVLAGLRELRDKYLLAEEDEIDALRAEYNTLLAKGQELIEQLRVDGVAAYVEAPAEDRELEKFLVKLVGDEIRKDQYERAAELAATLLQGLDGPETVRQANVELHRAPWHVHHAVRTVSMGKGIDIAGIAYPGIRLFE